MMIVPEASVIHVSCWADASGFVAARLAAPRMQLHTWTRAWPNTARLLPRGRVLRFPNGGDLKWLLQRGERGGGAEARSRGACRGAAPGAAKCSGTAAISSTERIALK